ncbi:hypothetical protein APS67_004603 [Streptomyces sp. AVP053U2]|nr:hypothetical protein APS67_004603 [Streptomyces sp. AVP053U2]
MGDFTVRVLTRRPALSPPSSARWESSPLPGTTAARTHLYLATGLHEGPVARDASEAGLAVFTMPLCAAVAAVRSGRITEAGSVTALHLASLEAGGA